MGLFGKKTKKDNSKASGNGDSEPVMVTLDGDEISITTVVDCIGDSCPRPQLMTKSALAKAVSGDVIEIDVDNPTSMEALPAVIAENGGTHLGTTRQPRHWQVIGRRD